VAIYFPATPLESNFKRLIFSAKFEISYSAPPIFINDYANQPLYEFTHIDTYSLWPKIEVIIASRKVSFFNFDQLYIKEY
jgi:hypothetical protein